MPECPIPLLGRELLTKFQTIVQFGDPSEKAPIRRNDCSLPWEPASVTIRGGLLSTPYFFSSKPLCLGHRFLAELIMCP